jgi:hypothetical protein
VQDRGIAACAEFPNDNPALHEGSIWYCAGVTDAVTSELRAAPAVAAPIAVVETEPATEPTPPVCVVNDESEAPATLHPLSPSSQARRGCDADSVTDLARDDSPPRLRGGGRGGVSLEGDEDDGDDIEIVDELPPDDVFDDAPPPETMPPAAEDPYACLMRVLEQVARDAGAPEATVVTLRTVLGQVRIDAGAPADHQRMRSEALAWQGILRGESEDFAACGVSMLDDWSALLLATLLGSPGRSDTLKRDLRRHGVAAFGLVDQAA